MGSVGFKVTDGARQRETQPDLRKGGGLITPSTDFQMMMIMMIMAKEMLPNACPISDIYSLCFEEKSVLITSVITV